MLADIGGSLGLWLGLNVFDLLMFFIMLTKLAINALRHDRNPADAGNRFRQRFRRDAVGRRFYIKWKT